MIIFQVLINTKIIIYLIRKKEKKKKDERIKKKTLPLPTTGQQRNKKRNEILQSKTMCRFSFMLLILIGDYKSCPKGRPGKERNNIGSGEAARPTAECWELGFSL